MSEDYVLELEHIRKEYPGVVALKDVTLRLRRGEVLGLIGENGAGKSTLIKCCSGAVVPTSGKIRVNGKEFDRMTPQLAAENGIAIIYQEFNNVGELSAAENLFLGRPIRKGIMIDRKAMEEEAAKAFEQLKIKINPRELVKNLSVGYQQMIEIAKAIQQNAQVLIMDEPSAPLTTNEVENMFAVVELLREKGVSIIYISHRLEEIFRLSDRIEVIRDGEYVDTLITPKATVDELIKLMVGREMTQKYPSRKDCIDYSKVVLELKNVCGNGDKDISLKIHAGEVLGLGGLVGAGRTELAEVIFGSKPIESGQMFLNGKEIRPRSPRDAIDLGIALVPEDRKRHGALLTNSIKNNINMPIYKRISMGIVTSLLYARFRAGRFPLALVSMDNVSHNGEKLRLSVVETAQVWAEKGLVEQEFVNYVQDERTVSFPWTMIDKITPRPSQAVAESLIQAGAEDMANIVVTSKKTYIAPFVNAEGPQYLVVEDAFPNGRPALEQAGVYMTTREIVNKCERMKVTVCLNPIHTALCTYACMLGYPLFADGMNDPELRELARQVGYVEGLPVVEDPGILSPKAFLDELMQVRFPNPYLGDTSARIAVDISQMVGIRFGENIKAYLSREGSAQRLTAIPLAIAGWIRYLLAVDDEGKPFELSPDPMIPELRAYLTGVEFGKPESLTNQLRPILSNANIFGCDLYAAGIGEKIEDMVRQELAGPGAVRATLKYHLHAL